MYKEPSDLSYGRAWKKRPHINANVKAGERKWVFYKQLNYSAVYKKIHPAYGWTTTYQR